MRTPTLFLLASTFSLAACDAGEVTGLVDADDAVAFRCGTPCVNSPYLGVYDITNQATRPDVDATSPDGQYTMRWTSGHVHPMGASVTSMSVSAQGVATVDLANGAMNVPITGKEFNLEIFDGVNTETGKIWFAGATTEPGDEDPSFTITRYDIRTNVDPGPGGHVHFYDENGVSWWSVCPAVDGSHTAVLLDQTHAHTSGSVGWVDYATTGYAIACDGHALSKGVTELNVVPEPGSSRGYGYDHYSSLIQGWQAVFQDSSWTYLGAQVGVVDLVNDPPLFDTLGPIPLPSPIVGQYEWILESVYEDTGHAHTRGAQCKYTGHPLRPKGEHRNANYDPPVDEIPGWSSLPQCSGDLSQYGDVAFYTISHMIYGGGGGSS